MSRMFEILLLILLASGSFALIMFGIWMLTVVRMQLALFAG